MSIYGGFKIMSLGLLIAFQLLISNSSLAADLINSTSIDVPFSKAQKQLNFQTDQCAPEAAQQCKQKYGASCICYKATVDLTRNFSRMVFVTVFNEKIVEYLDMRRTNSDNFVESYLPKIEAFSGDIKPEAVYVDSGGNRYEAYGMPWKKDGINYRLNALCPLIKYGGKLEMKTPIRGCYQYGLMASRFRTFPFDGWKKANKEY